MKNYISKEPYILSIDKQNKIHEIILNNKEIKKKQTKKKQEFSPLSGAEHNYKPELWNTESNIKHSHNCYSYALGKIVSGLKSKAQPGFASGFSYFDNADFTCKDFKKRLEKDSPGSYIESFDKKCLPGFYKIFLALDRKEDYHWWRQDSNKYWSHKPGSTEVSDKDGSDHKIKNPLLSNRNFKHRAYQTPCFFACVNSDLSRSLDEIY